MTTSSLLAITRKEPTMLGLNRSPPLPNARNKLTPTVGAALSPALSPALSSAPSAAATPPPHAVATPVSTAPAAAASAARSAGSAAHAVDAPVTVATGPAGLTARNPSEAAGETTEAPTSKLFVGVNIKLKGVEICDCDVLVVEGQVEASVISKAIEIAKPGRLTGTATIDVAEIHGEFTGEITARTRLVVHGTGRVCGTIRYGKLVVAEGGEVNGDVRQLDAPTRAGAMPAGGDAAPSPSRDLSGEARTAVAG
jgi:cytoskeletal protein CcmA (bactofilin family)